MHIHTHIIIMSNCIGSYFLETHHVDMSLSHHNSALVMGLLVLKVTETTALILKIACFHHKHVLFWCRENYPNTNSMFPEIIFIL